MKRVKLRGLLRNACIVAGNSGDTRLLPALVKLAEHELPLVRAHAVWAIHRLAGPASAASLLAAIRQKETDASVIIEYTTADREATNAKAATLAVVAEESPGRGDAIGS
jgi:epoxyqueuosine reductase